MSFGNRIPQAGSGVVGTVTRLEWVSMGGLAPPDGQRVATNACLHGDPVLYSDRT